MKLTTGTSLAIALTASAGAFAETENSPNTRAETDPVRMQQIRSATSKITYGDTTFLIDPMLSAKGDFPGFPATIRSELRNPLVDLTMPIAEVIKGVDAVIVTHTHTDHWDEAAQKALPKDLPLFVQNASDQEIIRSQGFKDVRVLDGQAEFGGVTLSKTGGQHGTDEMFADPEIAKFLGEAMGVVFQAPGQKTLYVAGDTIWRKEVDDALAKYRPELIMLNTGYAKLVEYKGSIIMGKEDVLRASKAAPDSTIIAVHMGAVNHMGLTRDELREYVKEHGIEDRVEIPEDGASLEL